LIFEREKERKRKEEKKKIFKKKNLKTKIFFSFFFLFGISLKKIGNYII